MKTALLFISVGYAALGCLVAFGCSSSDSEAPASATPDASVPDTKRPTPPPSGDDDQDDAGACPIPDADVQPPKYVAAKPHSDACSSAEMTKINSLLTSYGATITFKTFQSDTNDAGISAECTGCIFTDRTQDTWGPIPLTSTQTGSINFSGCYSQYSGSEDCGKTYLAYDACLKAVCDSCTAPGTERSNCYGTAAGDICKTTLDAWNAACASAPKDLNTACGNIGKVVATMCADIGDGGTGDAASDAN